MPAEKKHTWQCETGSEGGGRVQRNPRHRRSAVAAQEDLKQHLRDQTLEVTLAC